MFKGQSISVFCIIAAQFCERFSFCGLRTILSLYLRNVLRRNEDEATVLYHLFIMMCYSMPLVGAVLADNYIGRFRVMIYFSLIYLLGMILNCFSAMPILGLPPLTTSMIGLALIACGSGGIKPCAPAFGGDQFRLPDETSRLQSFFSIFYCTLNLGGFTGMVVTPMLRRSVFCNGDYTSCYALGFAFPAVFVMISTLIFLAGKPWYRIKQPRSNNFVKFVSCAWYALKKKMYHNTKRDGPALQHWLDYALHKHGEKSVNAMKGVCCILYIFLPVPLFWSLFDQQGSRWTFQASRLRSDILGVTLMPDQLQMLNPGLVLLMIPVCPGGSWSLLPDFRPLQKMVIGGILASLAFVAAGILQIAIERSSLQPLLRDHNGLVLMNTLGCEVQVALLHQSMITTVSPLGTTVVMPLAQQYLKVGLYMRSSAFECADRIVNKRSVVHKMLTTRQKFMMVIIGINSDDELAMYVMHPNTLSKSRTGNPKLKLITNRPLLRLHYWGTGLNYSTLISCFTVTFTYTIDIAIEIIVVYIGDTGPDTNVSITIETKKRLNDLIFVSNISVDHFGESSYMSIQPGIFKWRLKTTAGILLGRGHGIVRVGGVYILNLRTRFGRVDAAVLHAPNPPNEFHLAWIIPQYILISLAEIMFAIAGLEFSYTEAPNNMKTITIAAWYVAVAFGNLIVILVAQFNVFKSRQSVEFFAYAAVMFVGMLAFYGMSRNYQTRAGDCNTSSNESMPMLRYMSTSKRASSMDSEEIRKWLPIPKLASTSHGAGGAGGWPARAYVALGTVSSIDSDERYISFARQKH